MKKKYVKILQWLNNKKEVAIANVMKLGALALGQ